MMTLTQKFSEAGRRFLLIRVGGRLLHASTLENAKFTILLPRKNLIVGIKSKQIPVSSFIERKY